jgi:AAA+ ATPase superfamily predicted ATPase
VSSDYFVGRRADLDRLDEHLARVTATGRGRLLALQGRRQVGKSTLVTEFLRRHADVPALFFTASRQATVADDLARFASDAARESTLYGLAGLADAPAANWEAALRLVIAALPPGRPAVLVLDEFPWLLENDPHLDGTLQKLWDTALEGRPVLVVLVGSDLAMMEALVGHGRPLFGRVTTMVVRPFDPADTAAMLGDVPAVEAVDAHLVTGGYPRLLADLAGRRLATWLRHCLADDTSPLLVTGERILAGEFPEHAQARTVLLAVGAGARTFANIAQAVGIQQASLNRSLRILGEQKRVVARDSPVGPGAPSAPRYRVADPYLRFWLRFCLPALPDVARGRGDLALDRWRDGWSAYRGQAVEPLVQEALTRLAAGDLRLGGAGLVGGWWNRTNNPEIDLVGVDQRGRVAFTGTVKWHGRRAVDERDVAAHLAAVARVPALAGAPVVAVTATRATPDAADRLAAVYTPADLVAAFSPRKRSP